jgi:hypothetical protein
MKINLNFEGMPLLYRTLHNNNEMEFEFAGQTLRDLTGRLIRKFGAPMKDALLDSSGDIDLEIRVLVNNTDYLTEGRMETRLNDGDTLAFVMGG